MHLLNIATAERTTFISATKGARGIAVKVADRELMRAARRRWCRAQVELVGKPLQGTECASAGFPVTARSTPAAEATATEE